MSENLCSRYTAWVYYIVHCAESRSLSPQDEKAEKAQKTMDKIQAKSRRIEEKQAITEVDQISVLFHPVHPLSTFNPP